MKNGIWRDPQFWFNGIVAFFTAITAFVAYQQFLFMSRQERAWLVLKGVELISPPTSPDTPLSYALRFQNVGRSPVLDVSHRWVMVNCQVDIIPSPIPRNKEEIPPIPDCPAELTKFLIPWQQDGTVRDVVGLNADYLLRGTLNGGFPECFCGQIRYEDPSCLAHQQTLCWYYLPTSKQVRLCDVRYAEHDESGTCYEE